MATCASCGEWMSALVYACPACGAKPKGPAPRGLVISDTLPPLGFETSKKEGGPRTPRKGGMGASPAAQQQPQPSTPTEPFPKAPGPTSGAGPKPLDDIEPPQPAVRRTAPDAASRPPPRRPAPARKEPEPSASADEETPDETSD